MSCKGGCICLLHLSEETGMHTKAYTQEKNSINGATGLSFLLLLQMSMAIHLNWHLESMFSSWQQSMENKLSIWLYSFQFHVLKMCFYFCHFIYVHFYSLTCIFLNPMLFKSVHLKKKNLLAKLLCFMLLQLDMA